MLGRRSFLQRAAAVLPLSGGALLPSVRPDFQGSDSTPAWLAHLRSTRQSLFIDDFDVSLGRCRAASGGRFSRFGRGETGVALGFHGDALAYLLDDPLWRRLNMAERFAIQDEPQRQANVYARGGHGFQPSLAALRNRGVRLLVCNESLGRWSARYRKLLAGSVDDARAVLTGGLIPGVGIVPAMVVAVTQAQKARVPHIASV